VHLAKAVRILGINEGGGDDWLSQVVQGTLSEDGVRDHEGERTDEL